ncbi:MAG: histidine triad nucleotide-binding protein [Pseudohongiellaceae bacterium]
MASDCLFCRILDGEIPSDTVFENERVYAFRDISPQAPSHILVIPRKHIASLNELGEEDTALMGELISAGAHVARQEGLEGKGYRSVINTGEHGGQSVHHIHLHILGGRPLDWPPG